MLTDYCYRSGLALAVAGCLSLHGCANMPGSSSQVSDVPRMVSTHYYPKCYQPVEELRRYDASSRMAKRQEEARAVGIMAGAVLGAVAGAAMSNKHDRGKGAALGALAGAILGAMATSQQDQSAARQAERDRAKMAGKYAHYIGGDVSDMDLTLAAGRKAQGCYQNQYSKLLQDKKRGRIGAQEGRQRMTEIVAGLQETNSLIATVDSRFTENIAAYTQSYEESLQQSGVDRRRVASSVPTSKKATRTSATTKSVPKAARETERKLQQAQTKHVETQKVVQAGRDQVKNICTSPDAGDWVPSDKCGTT